MKIEMINNNFFIIYLNKIIINSIDFNRREELEDYFKNLFVKLKRIYNVDIKGYYNIKVFIDKYYGVVLEIKKEDVEYYSYFDNSVDMRINCINEPFYYELSDLYGIEKILNKLNIYKSDNRLLVSIKEILDDSEMSLLSEFSTLIYDNNTINSNLISIDK